MSNSLQTLHSLYRYWRRRLHRHLVRRMLAQLRLPPPRADHRNWSQESMRTDRPQRRW